MPAVTAGGPRPLACWCQRPTKPGNRTQSWSANGQPALGAYMHGPGEQAARANGLLVLTLAGNQISAITRFDGSLLSRRGLPEALPA